LEKAGIFFLTNIYGRLTGKVGQMFWCKYCKTNETEINNNKIKMKSFGKQSKSNNITLYFLKRLPEKLWNENTVFLCFGKF
jgi:hypothetical protein